MERNNFTLWNTTQVSGIKCKWIKLFGKAILNVVDYLKLKPSRIQKEVVVNYKQVTNDFNTLWGGKDLLYRWSNSNISWNVKSQIVDSIHSNASTSHLTLLGFMWFYHVHPRKLTYPFFYVLRPGDLGLFFGNKMEKFICPFKERKYEEEEDVRYLLFES